MMNCPASQDLLQQSLDGLLIESPQWNEHLRHCPECRTLAAASRRLQDGLRLLAAPLPSPDLATRIAERVLLDRRYRARRRARRRWAVSLALAAGLFIALALRLDWRGEIALPSAKNPESTVQKDKGKQHPAPAPADTPTLRESAEELSGVVAALTSQTADETMGQTRWLVPRMSSPSLPTVDLESMEPPIRPLREAGEGVSTGLEPVTSSARRAVDLFLRELPPMETGSKGS